MVRVDACLPVEEAAILVAAMTAATDQFGAPPDKPASTTTAESVNPRTYNYADALLDVARVFLDAALEDRSGEDRTMVVVHVAADSLSRRRISAGPADPTAQGADPTCHIDGVGAYRA